MNVDEIDALTVDPGLEIKQPDQRIKDNIIYISIKETINTSI